MMQSAVPAPPAPVDALPFDALFSISIDRYEAMIKAGLFTEDDRVDLIRGKLIEKRVKSQRHVVALGELSDWLRAVLPPSWFVSTESPVVIADSMPEPDAAVLRGRRTDYVDRRFTPEALGLIVEVSDSSLELDRNVKLSLYAEAGIPVYWIVNLRDRRIEVYTQPQRDARPAYYAALQIYGPDVSLPMTLDATEIATIMAADLLP